MADLTYNDLQGISHADIRALKARNFVANNGKDTSLLGKIKIAPVQLRSLVYWLSATAVSDKQFFDNTVNGIITKNYTGTKTYPNDFANENVEITHAKIIPDVAFAVLISSGTALDAYHYFCAATYLKWNVDNVMVFECGLEYLMPHMPVGNGAGTQSLDSVIDNTYVKLPEPIRIAPGAKLTVDVKVATGMTTAADAAATNAHIPVISTSVGVFSLQLLCLGTTVSVA